MLDRVPALIAYVDADGRYQWVNQAYSSWYGWSAEEIVGRPALEVLRKQIGPDYAEQLRPRVEEALRGVDTTFEATHSRGGKYHELLLSCRPDRDAAGAVRGFVLLVTDLSEQKQIARELQASDERFRTLTEALPSAVWTASPAGDIEYLSRQFEAITGISAEAALGSGWIQVIHPDDVPDTLARWESALRSGSLFEKQYRVRQRDGSYRWCLAKALPQQGHNGQILRWVGVTTDIHHQVDAARAIRESERRYRLLFDDNPLPMLTYDTRTLRILSANDIALAKYGYTRDEFLRMRVSDIRPEQDLPGILPVLHDPPHGTPIGPSRHRRKDGSVFWVEVTTHALSEGDPAVRLAVSTDVTDQVLLNEELARRAEHDPLTGLPNRTLLEKRFRWAVEQAKANGERIAVLILDFDRFKQVNDTFGHQAGDDFLRFSADKLLSQLQPCDTLARSGDDEFVVLARGLNSLDDCAELPERLCQALNEPAAVSGSQLQSSISVGLAIYPDDGEDLQEILRRADYGLYEARRAGKACWRRQTRLQKCGIQEALEIERSLRRALAEGRLELHYQPICTRQGKLVKLEALVRFPHPELGLLLPARFIPIAEEAGLIMSIGLWVQLEACRQIRTWRSQNLEVVPVALNATAAQFLRGNLADDLMNILEEYGVEPELLEIELTESALMENTERALRQLHLLKALGVRIAVDDFGTGYSSLSYLHWLPLDSLKIDGSFVQTIQPGGPNPIVQAIVDLGRNLRLSVVAECVETEEQYQELSRIGCNLFQGYLFSGPVPPAEISRLLTPEEMFASR